MNIRQDDTAQVIMFDDDAEDALLVKTALTRLDVPISFLHVQNKVAFEAVLTELAHLPDRMQRSLLLLDLNMPGKKGADWLKELRGQSTFDALTVVVFSTANMAEDRARSAMLGADDHLGKPDTVMELAKQLDALYKRWLKPIA
ncbi:response regulator [Rhodanobacter aciditrophus]|uniref:Response regulator n=1 Tax=Rhodanobacter aciditrophus TaxID=1623218 RepID=A0ABW4AXX8_9GAMM